MELILREIIGILIPQSRFIYKTILMTVFLSITYLFFKDNGNKAWSKLIGVLKQPWYMLFFLCSAYLFTCTVMGRYFIKPYKAIFGSFGLFRDDGSINKDMFANIIMFIPYVFLYLKAFKPRRPFQSALILSFGTTLFVEISQLIGWLGNFQIADIMHNLFGGMIGYVVWCAWEKLVCTIDHVSEWFSIQ